MLTDVINYSGIVAKIRAMRAKMLTDDDFRTIASCQSVPDILEFLKNGTQYAHLIDRVDPSMYRRSSMESLLTESLYDDYVKLYRFANARQKEYLRYFIKKYEVQMIKYCIGIVFNHYSRPFDIEFKQEFFSKYSGLDISRLVDSKNIDALVENLRGTEYYTIMHVVNTGEDSSIFDYELAMDLHYFRFMWSLRSKLADKKEVEILTKEIGSEIDMLNLDWIYRAKKYYSLVETEIYSLLIPIHYRIRNDEIRKMVASPNVEEYSKLVDPAETSINRIICAVMAVPTLAPRTIPMDWRKVRNPAPTRPTVNTMVAVELWIIQVTSIPKINPMAGLLVTLARAAFMAPPEDFFNSSPIIRIP